jgi:hypothetical protein
MYFGEGVKLKMKSLNKLHLLVPVLLCIIITSSLLAGCVLDNSSGGIIVTGSGNLQTKVMDLSGFTKIEVNNQFQAQITKADSYSVIITIDDNLFQYLDVKVSGATLYVKLLPNNTYKNFKAKAVITLPSLRYLNTDGAAKTNVSGFISTTSMDFRVSGSGRVEIADFQAGDTSFDNSGSGDIHGKMTTGDLKLIISGGATIDLEGSGKNMSMDASGGSNFKLSKFVTVNADLNVSGSADGDINVTGTINGDISGSSHVNYYGNPTLGKTSVTGGGSLTKK